MCVAQFNRPLRQVRQLAGNLAQERKEFRARQVNSSDWEITVIFSFVPDATEWRSANALAAFSLAKERGAVCRRKREVGLRKERFCCPGW
jgi:hypothetical protein